MNTAFIAVRMLSERRLRLAFTAAGLATLFFLSAAQVGLLVGWCNTNTAIIRNAGVDVWVMAEQTPAFDYGTPIPRARVTQARNVEGVAWAEAMYMGWNYWQRKDGRRVNIELVGLDSGSVGGPWKLREGRVEDVHAPDRVIVDELYLKQLGVERVGDEGDVFDRRAVVCGISRDVRTFTAAPFVFTSLRSAVRYDRRYREDEVTYVLVRCAPGHDPARVAAAIRAEVPHVEVLTTDQFAARSVRYWMLETGVGITVVLTAALGGLVSVVITSQTLFAITQEHLGDYATLSALGFGRGQLLGCVLVQALLLGSAGLLLGSVLFAAAAHASARTAIPLETTPAVYVGLAAGFLLSSLGSSYLSLRAVLRVDPVRVFRG
jgi:putative ABC transport system permease protein